MLTVKPTFHHKNILILFYNFYILNLVSRIGRKKYFANKNSGVCFYNKSIYFSNSF